MCAKGRCIGFRDRGFARSRRTKKDKREREFFLDGFTKEGLRSDKMILSDNLIQRLGSDAESEGLFHTSAIISKRTREKERE